MLEVDLKNQLTIARNEINNLRQQVRNLQHVQRKEIDSITQALREFRCEGCAAAAGEQNKHHPTIKRKQKTTPQAKQEKNVMDDALFRPIGVIRTAFPEKRAVPRQSSVGSRLRGLIELNTSIFSNPEHSLEGLSDYSHLWLIYHFHRNTAHPKAKVAPPRLGGDRVGVFSTRSPHRPCPIGLSLVEIEKIEGSTIIFYGTDMVDGTPILDIKPYIPYYDAPMLGVETGRISVGPSENPPDFYDSRQEPDGEESELELYGAVGNTTNNMHNVDDLSDLDLVQFAALPPPPSAVRVPNWVVASHRLNVCFNERAEAQLLELQVEKQCVVDILEADPRSVYLRTKYGSQIFTFQLSEVTVTCKFDDKAGTVTVVQVRRNENVQDVKVSAGGQE